MMINLKRIAGQKRLFLCSHSCNTKIKSLRVLTIPLEPDYFQKVSGLTCKSNARTFGIELIHLLVSPCKSTVLQAITHLHHLIDDDYSLGMYLFKHHQNQSLNISILLGAIQKDSSAVTHVGLRLLAQLSSSRTLRQEFGESDALFLHIQNWLNHPNLIAPTLHALTRLLISEKITVKVGGFQNILQHLVAHVQTDSYCGMAMICIIQLAKYCGSLKFFLSCSESLLPRLEHSPSNRHVHSFIEEADLSKHYTRLFFQLRLTRLCGQLPSSKPQPKEYLFTFICSNIQSQADYSMPVFKTQPKVLHQLLTHIASLVDKRLIDLGHDTLKHLSCDRLIIKKIKHHFPLMGQMIRRMMSHSSSSQLVSLLYPNLPKSGSLFSHFSALTILFEFATHPQSSQFLSQHAFIQLLHSPHIVDYLSKSQLNLLKACLNTFDEQMALKVEQHGLTSAYQRIKLRVESQSEAGFLRVK